MNEEVALCAYCGEPATADLLFLALWAVTSKATPKMATVFEGGEQGWVPSYTDYDDEEDPGGDLLHWPVCAQIWIDGKMAEQAVLHRG